MENKRKSTQEYNNMMSDNKKMKKDVCPHDEKCYRRNPHHFREFDHPHLNKLLNEGDDFELPRNNPQPRDVVVEQLTILKGLNKSCNKSTLTTDAVVKPTASGYNKEVPKKLEPSTSRSNNNLKDNTKSKKDMKKNTSFVPEKFTGHQKYTMAAKLEANAPYNLFFTTIPELFDTLDQKNAITFADLVCPSLGELKCSLQLNFMIDVSWLIEQYQVHKVHTKPLTILHGYEFPGMPQYIQKFLPNVKHHMVKMRDPFGIHHSKVGIYVYNDNSIRIVVSTANLYYEDWNHYNQGLWVSPKCPQLPDGSSEFEGESSTAFKLSLIKYLQTYNLPILKEWIEYIKKADFSEIKVFLVTSTPGKHYPKDSGCHIYRTQDLLTRHCKIPDGDNPTSWSINAQASSIGSLGKTAGDWLRSVLLRSLACRQKATPTANPSANINVIFPTVKNVLNSHFGPQGGGCLPYSKSVHEKQLWLQNYLHQWSADGLSRSKAMPHIKTYCRISQCKSRLVWFLITSANISKAAWGNSIQKDGGVYVRSYEVGVMFLPNFFDQPYFEIGDGDGKFPFMYDRILKPYEKDDYPWCN